MRERPLILLAVGPTVRIARAALAERGIDPRHPLVSVRPIIRAEALRGWSRGTPVVASDIDRWGELCGAEGRALAGCLLACLSSGRLRLLQDADLARFRLEEA